MGASVLEVRDRVQRYLAKLTSPTILEDGRMTFRNGSARFFIQLDEQGDSVFIRIWCPMVLGIKPSPAVYKYVALHADGFIFGHLGAVEEDGELMIDFSHRLLGDFLDEEELTLAVGLMATTADDLDDKLVAQFGGRVFHED